MALQCEVYILVARLYFTSKVITNKSQVDCVSTEKNWIRCLPMVITRGEEGDRGKGKALSSPLPFQSIKAPPPIINSLTTQTPLRTRIRYTPVQTSGIKQILIFG